MLKGDKETTSDSIPKIIPALQHNSVISVVLGDYHNGAVTSTGKLLTWGAYSKGALGVGDPVEIPPGVPGGFATENDRLLAQDRRRGTPPDVVTPTEVRFDHGLKKPRNRFCISAAAAGWHMGALVVDLEVRPISDHELYSTDGIVCRIMKKKKIQTWSLRKQYPREDSTRSRYADQDGSCKVLRYFPVETRWEDLSHFRSPGIL